MGATTTTEITEAMARTAATQAVEAIDTILDHGTAHPFHGDPVLGMSADEVTHLAGTRATLARIGQHHIPERQRVDLVVAEIEALDAGHGSIEAVVHAARALAATGSGQVKG